MTPVIDRKMPLSSKYKYITSDDGTYCYCDVTFEEFLKLKILLSKYYCQKIYRVIRFGFKQPLKNIFRYKYVVTDRMKNVIISYEKIEELESDEFSCITFFTVYTNRDSVEDRMVDLLKNEIESPLTEKDINQVKPDDSSESEEDENDIITQSQNDFENKEN